jgi:hypothetical protein
MKKWILLLLLGATAAAQQLPILPSGGAAPGSITNNGTNLTPGGVALATGATTVGTDTGLTFTGMGATGALSVGDKFIAAPGSAATPGWYVRIRSRIRV